MTTAVGTTGSLYNYGSSSGMLLNGYMLADGAMDSTIGKSVFSSTGCGPVTPYLNPMMGMCNPMMMGMYNPMMMGMYNPLYWNDINHQIQSSNLDFNHEMHQKSSNYQVDNSWIQDTTNYQIGIKDQVFAQQIANLQDAIRTNKTDKAIRIHADLYNQLQQKYSSELSSESRVDSDQAIRTKICELYRNYTQGSDLYEDVMTHCKGSFAQGFEQGSRGYEDSEFNRYYNEQVKAIMQGGDPDAVIGHDRKAKNFEIAKKVGKVAGPVGGAGVGALIGAFGGPVGALIGAGIGAVCGYAAQKIRNAIAS